MLIICLLVILLITIDIHTLDSYRIYNRIKNSISIHKSKLHNTVIGFDPTNEMITNSDLQLQSLQEVDYCIIGSGIGGLACAALLSYYGYSVAVFESHYLPGGVAHSFEKDGFKFDAGPSLWNGMNTKPYNPLREILELVGEGNSVEYKQYDGWVMHIPEGSFKFTVGEGNFEPIIKQFGGPNALTEWNDLLKAIIPLQYLSVAVPPLTIRNDPLVALTLAPHLGKLISGLTVASKVEGNFKEVSKNYIKDKFLENWFEFLSFALSGLPADGTIAAAVVYTMRDLHQQRAALDYPVGGSGAVVDALIRGIEKFGKSKVYLNSHIEEILFDNKRASGVKLRRKGKIVKAKRAVISNASIWDTIKLIPEGILPQEIAESYNSTPMTGSFVHLHIGIDATGLPSDLESHYTVINTWDKIDSPQNHVIISIPSVLDPSLAPHGCHVIHAYAAANEPYDIWKDSKGDRVAYKKLKEERCDFLWKAIERSIPDVRQRVKVNMSASPITHERFNRRYKGTFGPAFRAGSEKFPYPKTSIDGLWCCGDSRFPGIGVPAVAVSGAIAANTRHAIDMETFEYVKSFI